MATPELVEDVLGKDYRRESIFSVNLHMYFFTAHSTTLNFYLPDVILHISMFPFLLVLKYKKYPLENSEPPGCSESAHATSLSSPNSA